MLRTFGLPEATLLLSGFLTTIRLSLLAVVIGALGGAAIAFLRGQRAWPAAATARAFIDVFQGTPLLMQLFIVYFGLSYGGVRISPFAAVTVGLSLHASAFLGEIWHGAIQAVPLGQRDAARSLGLSASRAMYLVILPQCLPVALAPTVGFLVQFVKGTSVAAVVGFVELTRAGQLVNNVTYKPFLTFSCVGALYFLLCWPISRLGKQLEGYALRHGR